MENQLVDTILDSKKGDNIFDKYHALIEAQVLTKRGKKRYQGLTSSLVAIENNIIDLSDNPIDLKYKVVLLNDAATQVLSNWYPLVLLFVRDLTFINALGYNFFGLSLMLKDLNESEGHIIPQYVSFFSPSYDYNKILNAISDESAWIEQTNFYSINGITNLSVNELALRKGGSKNKRNSHYSFSEDFEKINFKLIHRIKHSAFGVNNDDLTHFEPSEFKTKFKSLNLWELINNYQLRLSETADVVWTIKIISKRDKPDAVPFFDFLHKISLSLSLISEDIEIKLEDWGNGSKWAVIKLTIKNFFSREDVKAVLRKGFESAEANYLEKPVVEVNKTKAEIEQIKKTTDAIVDGSTAKEFHDLELTEKKIDIVNKAMDAELKHLELKNKKLDYEVRLSEMIKNGLLQNESDMEIEINGISVYSQGLKLNIDMNSIANNESVIPKPEPPNS